MSPVTFASSLLSPVRIAVDCMGGDHGPSVTLPACQAFLKSHPQAELLLVGTAEALAPARGWPRTTVVTATEVVAWYNGHPDQAALPVRLDHERVVIIGNGNVALDVARILAKHDETYMPKEVVDALKKSGEWRPESGMPPNPGMGAGMGANP